MPLVFSQVFIGHRAVAIFWVFPGAVTIKLSGMNTLMNLTLEAVARALRKTAAKAAPIATAAVTVVTAPETWDLSPVLSDAEATSPVVLTPTDTPVGLPILKYHTNPKSPNTRAQDGTSTIETESASEVAPTAPLDATTHSEACTDAAFIAYQNAYVPHNLRYLKPRTIDFMKYADMTATLSNEQDTASHLTILTGLEHSFKSQVRTRK
jgi:hypothetical protein